MNPERWERIQALFHELTELPKAERRARIDDRCADDPTIVAEVLGMLEEDDRPDSMLDRDLAEVASRMLSAGGPDDMPRDFGPYRLRGMLGEGGMGAVFLAERPDLKNLVAIKILRDGWLSPARRQRFASEQRTMAQLNHPGIARLYDAGTLPDGTPWIAMEYVEGVPLTRYCAEHATTIPRVLEIFRVACDAVLHAHQHAVIHRDLKPSNILVTADGKVKLLDFGIAKRLEGDDLDTARTRTGEWPMTPAYAAPEQLRGGALGVQTDIYSLGVILFELLAGQPPFDLSDRTPGEVDRIIAEQEPERPSVVAKRNAAGAPTVGREGSASNVGAPRTARSASRGAWADLDVLCLTAMQKAPERRYRTVESLIRDIDHFLHNQPLEARPDSVGYRVGKFGRRNWRVVSAVSATLIAVIALVAFYTVRLTTARNQALAEAERTRRIEGFMTGLFEGGDKEAGPSDSLRVVTLIARGVLQARALSGEPAVQAELYQTLGGIYQGLGDFDRADSLMRAALDLRRSTPGASHADLTQSLVALGLLRADQSQLDEAERLVREGLTVSRHSPRPDPAGVARATTALGQVLEDRGSYDQAIQVLTEAARLDSSAALPAAETSVTLTELANCQFYSGRYAVSDSLNQRVLSMDRALYGERHPHVASDYINLGAIQKELGHSVEAEHYYRRALAIYRGYYGDEHFETAASLTMVGRALIPQGRYKEATELLRQSLAIREQVYGPDHPIVASTLNELALVAQKEGRLDEAEAGFRRMVAIYKVTYHDKHYLISLALCNLAGVLVDRKAYREAEQLFREGIRRYGETLPPDHLYVGIARIKLGRDLLKEERYPEAEKETLAGYGIVARQADPSVAWLQNARRDLVAEYHATHQPERGAKYQAELDRSEKSNNAAARQH